MRTMGKLFIVLWSCTISAFAELAPIMTIDSLADVYYDENSGDAVVADEIKALNGKKVRLAGYMVPFNNLENLKEFMLMPSSNGCNFCEAPMKEEMIYVRQKGRKKFPFIGDPLVLTGTLWVQGAGTPAPNKTYAQFLYALEDAKVEKLKASEHAILQEVTPRTIIKQVCSLLRVRLLKQVSFEALSEEAFYDKRKALLLKYLGGESGAMQVSRFLSVMGLSGAEQLVDVASRYSADWLAAFSNSTGDVIYYREGLDLSTAENQLQIAIACYDLLFHQEVNMGAQIHKGDPSFDERLARLSLILGLRQSFSQFYGSIGLIDMRPLTDFAKPFKPESRLPEPYQKLAEQLLINQEGFISELYKAEQFQPYTLAIESPPVSMSQILNPKLYMEKDSDYQRPILQGYDNNLGGYLVGLLLGCEPESVKVDGLAFTADGFTFEVQFTTPDQAESVVERLRLNAQLEVIHSGDRVRVTPKN